MREQIKKGINIALIAIVVGVIGVYTHLKTRDFLAGPQLSVSSPTQGTSLDQNPVIITGVAHNISFISMNNRKIFVDEKGNFSEKLLLYPGYNIITITAQDRFGRTTEKNIEINSTPYTQLTKI